MSNEVQEQSANYSLADLKPVLEQASGSNTLLDSLPIWLSAQTTKSAGRGRSADNTLQYGVQKLRELILELAVRGKLVEQDANNEPATSLIERIENDLEEVAKPSKSRKSKALPGISPDDHPYKLPQGWVFIRNGKLFKLRKGKKPKNLTEDVIGDPYLDVEALDRGNINRYTDDESCPKASSEDILVVCDGSRSGLVLDGMDGVIGSTLAVIQTPKWLQKYIKLIFSHGFRRWNTSMKGAAIPHLDTKNLVSEVTALPPLNEQHRIVKKVDELMALCDKLEQQQADAVQAHDTLVKVLLDSLTQSADADDFQQNWHRIAEHFDTLFITESSIDQLKQTLLQLAVMGKLVPQDPNDEPASVLLEKISEEKEMLRQSEGMKTKASEELEDKEKYISSPESWAWIRIGNTSKFIDYRGGTPKKVESGRRLITAKNVRYGYLDIEPQEFITEDDYHSWMTRGFPKTGDILFTTEAPLGNVASIDIQEDFALAQRVICMQWHIPEISSFMLIQMMAKPFQNQLIDNATGMTATGIKAAKLKEIPVVLPPLAEQHRIVKKVDELMALCDQLKDRLNQAQILQQQLADAVVEQTVN